MRQSLSTLIDTCFDIKVHLQANSYELRDYEDGAIAKFKVNIIRDPKTLLNLIRNHTCRIYAEQEKVVVEVDEDYQEY